MADYHAAGGGGGGMALQGCEGGIFFLEFR